MTRDFPVPRSDVIKGIEWLSERLPYPDPSVKGDTYPMTWADDGEIYASSGDPNWGEKHLGLDVVKLSGTPPDYTITRVHPMPDYDGPGGEGPKPSGMICVEGVLYLAVQNLKGKKPPVHGTNSQHGSDASILCSADKGRTWVPEFSETAEPMFPGSAFGGPAFVNFGRDNAGARDEFVYAVSTDQWDNGTHLRLGRVPAERIMERSAWQWVSQIAPGGGAEWTNALEEAAPVLSDDRFIGLPEMVYLPAIKRYLLLTWRLRGDFSPTDGTDLIVYESPEPWGPFALVHFEELWEGKEVTPYCPRVPLKWMEEDGLTGWLQCSGSWASVEDGSYYRSHVHKFRLVLR